MPLSKILPDERNPKDHDIPMLMQAYRDFGFVVAIVEDGRTGKLLAGHGRVEALEAVKSLGEPPPKHIMPMRGEWLVPVQVGYSSEDDTKAAMLLVELNQATIAGGYNPQLLSVLLLDVVESGYDITSTGFAESDLDSMLNELAMQANTPPIPGTTPGPTSDDVAFSFGDYSGRVTRDVYERFRTVYERKREPGEMLDTVLRTWLKL